MTQPTIRDEHTRPAHELTEQACRRPTLRAPWQMAASAGRPERERLAARQLLLA